MKAIAALAFMICSLSVKAQQFDGELVYYEKVLEFNNQDKQTLAKAVEKFLLTNNYPLRFSDSDEVHASGRFDALYKGWFLVFYNTTEYKVYHDIIIGFKDNKIKYKATNFKLVPYTYNVPNDAWRSRSWRIQTDIPSTPIEKYYSDQKTGKKHKLFPMVNSAISDFEQKLKNHIERPNDNW